MNKDYSDILNLPHPVSEKHPRMSLYDRAAQFSPFAALTGYDAAIEEIKSHYQNVFEVLYAFENKKTSFPRKI